MAALRRAASSARFTSHQVEQAFSIRGTAVLKAIARDRHRSSFTEYTAASLPATKRADRWQPGSEECLSLLPRCNATLESRDVLFLANLAKRLACRSRTSLADIIALS
mmetsp:Transcript_14020/g.45228  ORF Transcript_14020/g.45228 Transcript_14020/m.45228 type:complete len:108 (-) Transcript_14020:32-355(-)